jgi:hypothetical protein
VFTQRSLLGKIWSRKSEQISIVKKQRSFNAVAVVAVVDVNGELIAYELRDKSIKLDDLTALCDKIKAKYKQR